MVAVGPGGLVSVGNITSVTITGLTNGATYTVQVRAKNAAGNGPYSLPSAPVTPFVGTPPTATFTVSTTSGQAPLTIQFTDDPT